MKFSAEKTVKNIFLLSACVSIFAVLSICVFLFVNGIPAVVKIGAAEFLGGQKWKPLNNLFGILPMIAGSLCVTIGALVIGVPGGILTAVFLVFSVPKNCINSQNPRWICSREFLRLCTGFSASWS
jgi:phosphate transport system permease protein